MVLIAAVEVLTCVTVPTLLVIVEPRKEESVISELTVMVEPVSVERFITDVISDDTTKEDS
jgi:hypothetical protein